MKLSDQLSEKVYFVTGIDTDCGKTIATGYISRLLMAEGVNVITQKLIQTGNKGISEDICKHRDVEGRTLQEVDLNGITCPLIYSYPCSPHMAAVIDEREPDYGLAAESTRKLISMCDKVLVEGAGGLMVPLKEDYLTRDYVLRHELPVILVTTARLGSINHTLLNLEVLRHSGISLAALVYNRAISTDERITQETERYLQVYLKTNHPEVAWIDLPQLSL